MLVDELYKIYLSSAGICTDTRSIVERGIFFALKGENYNANLFAEEALAKGASYAIVDELHAENNRNERLIVVPNALKTLQDLAAHHRSAFQFPVLAITGSNGKTTTKELIAAVLSKKYKTAFTKGNLNNHIGIPITILSINKDNTEFAVIEMGANHQGEIASYCNYVQPDYGLITNLGLAHIEGFGGPEGVIKGKTELYRHLALEEKKVFVASENKVLKEKWLEISGRSQNIITYGTTSSYCQGALVPDTEFVTIEWEKEKIQTNLIGDYNFENVMSAICIGKYFGVDPSDIKSALESYVPSNNRSQKIKFKSNTVILDAYNANPSSMREALKNFNRLMISPENEGKQPMIIIGEMMELGEYSSAEHKKILEQLENPVWNTVSKIFVGAGFKEARESAGHNINWFQSTDDLKSWFMTQNLSNHFILIKGSRKNELEKILKD